MKAGVFIILVGLLLVVSLSFVGAETLLVQQSDDSSGGSGGGSSSEEIAMCIGENSELYVQLGCNACETQKEMFGDNYKYLNVIDCWSEKEKCSEIQYTPTWIINGEKYTGVQSIEKLKELTGCEERCYSDKDCEDILCVIPIDGDYEVYRHCNSSSGKCYCDIYHVVDYNEKFTLKEGQKVIIPGRYFITLEDIYGICKMSDYCYYTAKLWYHTIYNTFYMKEGDVKEFGDNVIPPSKEKPILKLIEIKGNEATFIVYPKSKKIICCKITAVVPEATSRYEWMKENECVSNIGTERKIVADKYCRKECYQDNDCNLIFDWCSCSYKCIPKNSIIACADREGRVCTMEVKPVPKCECMNNKCVTGFEAEIVIVEGVQQITGMVVKEIGKDCNGCFSNNECLPVTYRTLSQYCDADKNMKNQKSAGQFCNNNFECKTNICVDGKCVSSGLIQKILNFFKRLFGL